ncbi:MAG TPA: FtsX-like permease family protein [Acidimicrobiales bacterium]|nr:FtsX-like permease family protein [Acidimicrobiales bacterium]
MIEQRLDLARYRARSTFRRSRGGYLALIILLGLVAGLGLGSLSAARRTQSSFTDLLATTNPSDLQVSIYSGGATNLDYRASLTREMARLPGVRHVAAAFVAVGAPLTRDGSPRIRVTGLAFPVASVNGLFFTQDRMIVNEGRLASPRRPDEIVMAPVVAKLLGFHVGEVIPFGFYSNAQQSLPQFGTKAVPPALRVNMKLVGLASLSSEIVEDDVDTLPTFIPLTPAFAREALAQGGLSGALTFGITTSGGTSTVPRVERELARLTPRGFQVTDHALAPVVAKADNALKPISIALGVFGAIALLAAILIATQLIARRLRVSRDDLQILRSLGADTTDTLLDGLIGLEAAIAIGSMLAVGIAVALSPLAPLGPVRAVFPGRGFTFDWTVLGFGFLFLIVVLGAVAVLLALATAPHRVAHATLVRRTSGARVVGFVARAGLSAPGVIGVRMALEPGEGRAAVPVRSALLGSVLAVALVVTTLTFGNSLQMLVATPPLYGWNWTYILNPVGAGWGEVPQVALKMLKHDKDVAAYSGASFNNLQMDGQEVPFLLQNDGAPVAPPILTGHGLHGSREAVLGTATMAQLHKRLGQDVTISFGAPTDGPYYIPPTRLRIVGTATFPAIGFASTVSDHTSMGTGLLLSLQDLPKSFVAAIDTGPDPVLTGPNLVLVRIRPGVPSAAGLAGLNRIVAAADRAFAAVPGGSAGNAIVVQGVQRPAEIVNYKTIGMTPSLLVAALVLGAVAALTLTLVASVRQRRRDLALLKTIGFVRRQLASAVAWQATVAATVGIVIGIPLGLVVGRMLWDLFARQINAVPYPTVSVPSVVVVAAGTVLLANLVAAIPARTAARTPTALLLREE